ncbi:MAG: fibrobacter succinogenes major paralogous domain-containing protein [Sandaracinaceae bacterium]|nr:fibrobacter succinogenes major paralogous domain-containing protein [Sandaracinaceae bacterium]
MRSFSRLFLLAAVASSAACGRSNYVASDASRDTASALDAGPGLDAPFLLDAPLLDAPFLDAPLLDAPFPDAPIVVPDAPSAMPDAPSAMPDASMGACRVATALDADGHSYGTVSIGTQCWLASNLIVGTRIPGTTAQTNNAVIEHYCYGDAAACEAGGLYTWQEAMQYVTTSGARGICPSGFHIPNELEWEALERSLGMPEADIAMFDFRGTTEGTALKLGGSSGFDGVLIGIRDNTGTYFGVGTDLFLWASDEGLGGANGVSRRLNGAFGGIERYGYAKANAFAIRCVQD